MENIYMTREELRYAERITALEIMTAEIKESTAEFKSFAAEIEKKHAAHQRFNMRLIAGMLFVVTLAFVGAAYNTFGISQSLATLKTDVSVLKTDVSVLKTDVSALQTDVSALQKGQAEIVSVLQQANLMEPSLQ